MFQSVRSFWRLKMAEAGIVDVASAAAALKTLPGFMRYDGAVKSF